VLTYSSPDDVGDASTDSRQQQKKWKFEKPLGNRHADREVDEVCDPKHESNCEQMLPSGSTNKEAGKDSGLCLIRHKPDHVGLWIMSDQLSG